MKKKVDFNKNDTSIWCNAMIEGTKLTHTLKRDHEKEHVLH